MRIIIHLDMDAFFATAEVLRRPELKGKPVVVGGRGNPRERGVVSTASYEARRYGIRSAMPLRIAYRLCPKAIFLKVDIEYYRSLSKRIFEVMRRYTPLVEPLGLDEAFLDVTGIRKPGEEIARELKERIKEEVGLTASVGVAPNKLLAKIASGLNKPDGLVVVEPEEVEQFLSDLPVSTLWGVGPKTEARLSELGIRRISELRRRPLGTLVNALGSSLGRTLYRYARGVDDSPVVIHWEPKSLSRETTFQRDVKDLIFLKSVLRELTQTLLNRLKKEGYQARTLGIKIRYQDFSTHTRALILAQPTSDYEILLSQAIALLERCDLSRRVRLIGVRLANLSRV